MLRITCNRPTKNSVELKIEGWLETTDVELLGREMDLLLQQDLTVSLAVDEVRQIGDDGLKLLKQYGERGVAIKGGSLFLLSLLKAYGIEVGDH